MNLHLAFVPFELSFAVPGLDTYKSRILILWKAYCIYLCRMARSMRFMKICYFHEGCIFTGENMPITPHGGLALI